MYTTHKIKMDLLTKQNIQTIHAVHDDTNSRYIEISLFECGVPWKVPENSQIAISYLAANGANGIYDTLPNGADAYIYGENKITIILVPSALYPGTTKVTVVISDENSNQISTFPLNVEVDENYSYGASKPETYINLRQWLSKEIRELLTYYVHVEPDGDGGYFTDSVMDDVLQACASDAPVICRLELPMEPENLQLPLAKHDDSTAYFSAVFEGKEYLVTINADGVTVEQSEVGSGGGSGNPGEDGGYYTPTVTDNGDGTVEMSFTPSTADMPAVAPKTIALPVGPQGEQGPQGPQGETGAAGKDGKDAVLAMFISPDGSDSNDGLSASTPKKTVKACVNAGATRICAKRGVYKEIVQLSHIGELEILPTDNDLTYAVGVEREPIVFDTSDTVAVSSLAAYNSIKRVAYSNSANTQFDKVFTAKSQPPVVGTGYGSRYNSTIWLLSSDEKTVCIKLKPVLTVAECEAEVDTFSYVDGYIYINADMTSVEKVIVPTNWETGFRIEGAERLVLKEVEVRFSGAYNIDIRNCAFFDFYKCACKYTSYGSGFHPFNSNGKMTACYATKNYDGYGISGYGHTTYVDCVSEFNFDDGMSHHDGTSGTVIGGRYEGNGKGGNTPAYGAKVNIYGGLYKGNASFGIGYLWATDLEPASGMVQGAVMVGNPVGLSVQKNCVVTAMNCTYQGNTSDKDVKGNLTEYNANYVKSVNGVLPDENGNVEIEVSGGEDGGNANLLHSAINSDGTEYVGANGEDGYKAGYRVSTSGAEKASDKNCCTGFIPAVAGEVFCVENTVYESSGYCSIYFFNSTFSIVTGTGIGSDAMAGLYADGVLTFTVPDNSNIAYFRITAGTISGDTVITKT